MNNLGSILTESSSLDSDGVVAISSLCDDSWLENDSSLIDLIRLSFLAGLILYLVSLSSLEEEEEEESSSELDSIRLSFLLYPFFSF